MNSVLKSPELWNENLLNEVPFKDLTSYFFRIGKAIEWERFYADAKANEEDGKIAVMVFDKAMSLLSKEDRQLLENELNFSEAKGNWWMSMYSRSTYYRNKRKAIINFLLTLKESRNNVIFELTLQME